MSEEARGGFTLIELMITVSIVGILAAIALPEYDHMLQRTKRAEIPMNVDAIRTVEVGYYAEWGQYTSCTISPAEVPGRVAVPFPATPQSDLDWNELGWVPDGKVYGQYEVIAQAEESDLATFVVNGYADIDGDTNLSHFRADEMLKPVMLTGNVIY